MCAPVNGIQIGQQLESVKGLGLIAIGPYTQHIDLVINAGIAGNDEDWKGRVVFADQSRQPPSGRLMSSRMALISLWSFCRNSASAT